MPIINRIGGGGDALRLKVRNYTELPETGEKNEIAIITEAAIPHYAFAAENPLLESIENGTVWIKTGASDVSFYADRKQTLSIDPTAVYQYIDESWTNKEAYVYLDGEWVQFSSEIVSVFLYSDGAFQTDVVGSFKKGNNILSETADGWLLRSETNGSKYNVSYFETAVDLSQYIGCELTANFTNPETISDPDSVLTSDAIQLVVIGASNTTVYASANAVTTTEAELATISIDLTSFNNSETLYRIGIRIAGWGSKYTNVLFKEWRLLK